MVGHLYENVHWLSLLLSPLTVTCSGVGAAPVDCTGPAWWWPTRCYWCRLVHCWPCLQPLCFICTCYFSLWSEPWIWCGNLSVGLTVHRRCIHSVCCCDNCGVFCMKYHVICLCVKSAVFCVFTWWTDCPRSFPCRTLVVEYLTTLCYVVGGQWPVIMLYSVMNTVPLQWGNRITLFGNSRKHSNWPKALLRKCWLSECCEHEVIRQADI